MTAYALADLALARRLERAEGSANAAFVEARARLDAARGVDRGAAVACWREIAGAYAMFDTVGSPITQTFGLGLFAPATDDDLAALEAFFAERGAEVFHEVSPIAEAALMPRLVARGYRPIELTSMMYRPVVLDGESRDGPPHASRAPRARIVSDADQAIYVETSARGWSSEGEGFGDMVRDFAAVTASARGTHAFVAELDGEAIAAAALAIHGGVAIFAGASTVPAFRGRGAQAALLAARLRTAAAAGCDLAMMGALPGSASQRNAERAGFRIAYTRIKWTNAPTTP